MNGSEQCTPAFLEEIVGDRFGRYSKYIIQDRAIPDVRDGLKPVQRRILYAMYHSSNTPDKPYRKSAKTVGDVMGNYHPHGDASIYDGMVRMAQPWKMLHTLVDGHGNWGSQDDDPAAAMRYTEARLSPIAMEMLRDIRKDTVSFKDNFDNTEQEPVVLPSRYPNLLVNGASGISSGFATEIPSHNLGEVIDACIALMEDPTLKLEQIMRFVKGPDFPTGGIVMNGEGILDAYRTGKGRIYIRSQTSIESLRGGKQQIVITQIPYQVVKSRLVTAMETIRLEKKVEGIAEVRDESGRDGLKIIVELKKEADAKSVLGYLLKKTDLQVTYNFNMVAIVNKAPQQLGLKAILQAYVDHQREVVTKRTTFLLAKGEDRAHVLEGLIKALGRLDEVISTIRSAKHRQDAEHQLQTVFRFSPRQTEAILTLQLYRLTNLEITSLQKEWADLQNEIFELREILSSDQKLIAVLRKELLQVRRTYGVNRRSLIQQQVDEIKVSLDVVVPTEDVIVTFSHLGYVKRTSKTSFIRSGGSLHTVGAKEGDVVLHFLDVNTLDTVLVFTKKGRYFPIAVHQIPESKWKDSGIPLINLIPYTKEEQITSIIPIPRASPQEHTFVFVTKKGQVKRSKVADYPTKRAGPIVACKMGVEDELAYVCVHHCLHQLMLFTRLAMTIRFDLEEVNIMGRVSSGVRGIQLHSTDEVIGALCLTSDGGTVAVLSNAGYGKCTSLEEYPLQKRGGKGIPTFEFKEGRRVRSNGTCLVGAFHVIQPIQILMVSKAGQKYYADSTTFPLKIGKDTGKLIVPLDKGDEITTALTNSINFE